MEYKVIPFVASIDRSRNAQSQVAEQLESLIKSYTEQQWIFIRVESISSFVKPESGCFGFGGSPGYNTTRQMIIFKK